MHDPIPTAIRTANGQTILKAFPSLIGPRDQSTSLMFALAPSGGSDDFWILGPISRPTTIMAVTYVSDLVPATTRTFRLYATTDGRAIAPGANDVNLLDPLSPSPGFTPTQKTTIIRIVRPINFNRWWLKLYRLKGGSTT